MNEMKAILKYERTEFGRRIRKKYEAGQVKLRRNQIRISTPRTDDIANTLAGVTKDNHLYEDDQDSQCDKQGLHRLL